jgi:hypothetical protein
MEILGKMLGSAARVKIMRAFLLNPKIGFSAQDLAKRCRVMPVAARRELRILASIDFIQNKTKGWVLNPNFKYVPETEALLLNADSIDKTSLANTFRRLGRIKLLIVSGIFIKDRDARVDLLVVGDGLKKKRIQEEVKKLEAEIGVELTYAMFDTAEFIYRVSMYDKLVRDILDFPHEALIQAKELSTQLNNGGKKLV